MDFNKENFKTFREELSLAIKALEEKNEIKISVGKIKYGATSFDVNLNCTKNSSDCNGEQIEFEKACEFYGFARTDYRRQLKIQNELFELIALNTRKPTNNCTIQRVLDSKKFIINDKAVKASFVERV